ncbi:MAG: glycosyltransferase family 2 protein [Tannerella sp.]|nr:glycosyltransferase family 2 protein [Tannerella sp.]
MLPRLSYITSLYFDQGDVQHLYELLLRYNAFPAAIKQYLQFVLVDDCSVDSILIPSQINMNIKLLRITNNIAWNQPGAKNLGVTLAPTSKILLTDIDHYITPELMLMLLESPEPYHQIYIFERENEAGEKIKNHRNTFFTSKSVFFKSLGYDEQFCGNYGHDDSMFFLLQQYLGAKILYFNKEYSIQYLEYAERHHSLKRDNSINNKLYKANKAFLSMGKDPLLCHSRLFLNFKWEIVEERFYQP